MKQNSSKIRRKKWNDVTMGSILGDPRANSRDDTIFSGDDIFGAKVYFKSWRAPGNFFSKRIPEVVEIHPADWPEKHFSGQPTKRSSRVMLSPSYTKCFHSSIDLVAWPVQRGDSILVKPKPRKSQTVIWKLEIEATLFHQFSRRIYRRYIVNLYS